jgi:parallel beta-helix repeat protein
MRLNGDASSDLVVLRRRGSAPSVVTSQPATDFTVINTNDDGPGSLRQAIQDANDSPGDDTISFDIPGPGPHTINLASELPSITETVMIDATTDPDFAGTPIVELNGGGTVPSGFIINDTFSVVIRGFVINRFSGDGISIIGSGDFIEGNYIGTNAAGTATLGNAGAGISLSASGETIGGTTAHARNVISGNLGGGVIDIGFSGGIRVLGNYIGTDVTGTTDLGNSIKGISIISGGGHTIEGNIISGNEGPGVDIEEDPGDNLIADNNIGTDAMGSSMLGNSGNGIEATEEAITTITNNVISGNAGHGVIIDGLAIHVISANFIGTDRGSSLDLGNSLNGINISTGLDVTGIFNNIVSGNGGAGIFILSDSKEVSGNTIGTNIAGAVDLGNQGDGIFVAPNSVDIKVHNNRVAFNNGAGIRLPESGIDVPPLDISIISNSVYSNVGLGIDLGPAGNTFNDPKDPDIGANLRQNFPVLTSAITLGPSAPNVQSFGPSTTTTIRIIGNLNSTPNTDFYVQFYSATQCNGPNPVGNHQFINSVPILFHTDASGNAPIDVMFEQVMLVGQFVNALARHPSGNTSELSLCIQIDTSADCNNSIGSPGQSFPPSGGTDNVTVTAGPGCVWTAVSNDSFLTITSEPDGTGNGTVSYQVAANPTSSQRTGTMTIAGETFTVTQQGAPAPCTFSLNSSGQHFTNFGGNGSFDVMTAVGCNWTPITNVGWISAMGGGSGDETVNFFVEENVSGPFRTGTISVQGQVFTVTQDGAGVVCTYSITPASDDIPSTGDSRSFTLTTGSNCNWNAAANFHWITLQFSGTGGGTINYTVAPNPGGPRTGMIFIEGQVFTINQCGYTLNATSESFAANGGTDSFNVTTQGVCAFAPISNDDWITVNGVVGSTVSYSVGVNTVASPRFGTITVGNQTFTVLQGAAFLDVPQEHPFYTDIGKLSARGVTTGCDVGLYCPDLVVTRQQMAAFIIRALGDFNPPDPPSQRFVDVPPGNTFYAFIEQMAVRRITEGCDTNPLRYCPLDPVLRDQMAAFIIRALGEFDPPDPPFQRFLDVPPSQPFYRFIDRMAVLGITNGCDVNLYCPSLAVTRGQMAAFLVRAFNL